MLHVHKLLSTVAKVILEIGINKGLMTTIHAYTMITNTR